jgi:hypothetical protein
MEKIYDTSIIEPGYFGKLISNVVIEKNFVELQDIKVIQKFLPIINKWENPMQDEFNEDGTCTYDANYWLDRMCSGAILKEYYTDIYYLIDKYIKKMQYLLEDKFSVKLYQRPPVLVRWLPGNEQHPHADKQLNDGSPNPFPTYDINSIIYWNENFEGGEFYYPEFDMEIKIQAGLAIAHPGDIHYLHGVKKIISGERWTTPSFYTVTSICK